MLTKDIYNKLKQKRDNENTSYRQLSMLLEQTTGDKIPPSTLNDWLNGGFDVRKNKEVDLTNEQFEKDKDLAIARAETKIWKNKYKQVVEQTALQDNIIERLETYVKVLKPLSIKEISPKNQHLSEHRAVLLLSDLHLGEVVDLEQTNGIGQFNMKIASKRLHLLAEKVLELVNIERSGLKVNGLDIFALGDMVSGGNAMHDELIATNEINVLEQTTSGAHMLAYLTGMLAPHFNNINVYGVPGNHGRMAKKPYFKDRYANFDYILYQLWSMLLKEHKNVKFNLTKSFFQIAQVLNTRFLLLHGDGIRGFNGYPWYGVERAIMRLRQMLDIKNDRFDMVILGHFHEAVETERFICNGNLKGSEEYSIGSFFPAVQPSQTLFFVNENNGVVNIRKIYLSSADNRKELGLPIGISSVWANDILEKVL